MLGSYGQAVASMSPLLKLHNPRHPPTFICWWVFYPVVIKSAILLQILVLSTHKKTVAVLFHQRLPVFSPWKQPNYSDGEFIILKMLLTSSAIPLAPLWTVQLSWYRKRNPFYCYRSKCFPFWLPFPIMACRHRWMKERLGRKTGFGWIES